MSGDNWKGKYDSGFAAGIYDASSADPEPTAMEIRKESENSISLDLVWKKKASAIGPFQSLLGVLTRDGHGADKMNDRHSIHALSVQSPNQFVSTDGDSSPPLVGVSHEIDASHINETRIARPMDLHVQRGTQIATQTSKSGVKTEIEIKADKLSDDITDAHGWSYKNNFMWCTLLHLDNCTFLRIFSHFCAHVHLHSRGRGWHSDTS